MRAYLMQRAKCEHVLFRGHSVSIFNLGAYAEGSVQGAECGHFLFRGHNGEQSLLFWGTVSGISYSECTV